jgi:hypothetical protein
MQTIKGLSSPFFYAQKKPRRVGVQGGAKQTTTKGKHTVTYPNIGRESGNLPCHGFIIQPCQGSAPIVLTQLVE